MQSFHRIRRQESPEPIGAEAVFEGAVQHEGGAVVVAALPGEIELGHEGGEVGRAAETAELAAADQGAAVVFHE